MKKTKEKSNYTIEIPCTSKHKLKLKYNYILDKLYLKIYDKHGVKKSTVILDGNSIQDLSHFILWNC